MTRAQMIGGGVLVALVALWLLTRSGSVKGIGAAIGGGAVDLITGTVGGVAGAVVDTANDPAKNPLQPFGAWLGGAVYGVTHPGGW